MVGQLRQIKWAQITKGTTVSPVPLSLQWERRIMQGKRLQCRQVVKL